MALMNQPTFRWQPLSKRQIKVFTWWTDGSPYKDYDGIVADGAIRSGKTVSMGASFVFWAMERFNDQNFAICGKTIKSVRRNVVGVLKSILSARGYDVADNRSDNMLTIRRGGTTNRFYLFGGRDERSQDLIQGVTLAGILLDEVALMPESFVNQAVGRCSVEGSKFWFNCNPEGPEHYVKCEWINKYRKKHLVYLHFALDDNPSLSEKKKEQYRSMFRGIFHKRYVLGLWVLAEGLIYPSSASAIVPTKPRAYTEYQISCDYGIHNPTAFGLFGKCGDAWYMVKEYYHSGRETNEPKTDDEYYAELDKFAGDLPIRRVIVDPSASSFITLIQRRGRFTVKRGDNAVLDGIRSTATAMNMGILKVNDCCKHLIAEFNSYSWDDKSKGEDRPIKESDHVCDLLRYFVHTNKLAVPRRGSLLD